MKNATEFTETVTFRLTLWYTVLLGTFSLVVFLLVYASLGWNLSRIEDEDLMSEAKEFMAIYSDNGLWGLDIDFKREARASGVRRVFFLLLSENSEVLASSDLSPWGNEISFRSFKELLPKEGPSFFTLSFPGHAHKVRVLMVPTGDGKIIVVGKSRRDADLVMKRYRETFAVATVVMLVFGALLGWFLSLKSMAGVKRVTQTAREITKGDLSKRVPAMNEGLEIDALAQAFNEMLDRIEAAVRELKEVTDNIAHDLRSPVTRIRGIAETTLTGSSDLDEFREMAATVVEESDRLVAMVNTMLEITKAESGMAEMGHSEVEMVEMARNAAEIFSPMAEEKGVTLETRLPSHPVTTRGDRAKLQRVLANLLDNAIKYTPAGGRVSLVIADEEGAVKLVVEDTVNGIDQREIPKIFNRFYRGDKSRSTPGSGLGLSLAQALVRAHGGEILVESTPNEGSRFTVVLPGSRHMENGASQNQPN